MPLYLRYAVRSDLGLVRTNNEDSVYAGPRLLAIADGMGGHAAGEVASKIVIGTMEHLDEDRRVDDLMASLRDSVDEANHRLAAAVEKSNELEGMGTTLTALRFTGSQVGLVHVGDSRAYLLRNHQLVQITHDDTYVQYLVDAGKLTPDEATVHPRKSALLRVMLGTEIEPDVSIREARAGDRYLLCSDGLSDVVSADTIAETLGIEEPQDAADRLVELALRSGGPDNVTVIVADVLNARLGDRVDDVPVVAGAFVEPGDVATAGDSTADENASFSAAERAARITSTARPAAKTEAEPDPPTVHRRRRSLKPWLGGAAALVLVLAALAGAYVWTQDQYFVGGAGGDVAIFRGVNTAFGPLRFFSVAKVTGVPMRDLTPSARAQVRGGITARSKADAENIVRNLNDQLLPACMHTAAAAATSTPSSAAPSPTPTSTPTASTRTSGTPAASTPATGAASSIPTLPRHTPTCPVPTS